MAQTTAKRAIEKRRSERVRTFREAVRFVERAGICMLFPVRGIQLPSLYYAATGRNLFEDWVWDKYSEMVWGWKDELPQRRRAFYGKFLRGRGTLISLEQLPNFLVTIEAAVETDDHQEFYECGRISEDARIVWSALEEHGPLATLELRHACGMETKAGNVRYKRAILDLQRTLIVVHSGAEQESGAWASAKLDLTCRAFPEALRRARAMSAEQARANIAAKCAENRPDAAPMELARLFVGQKRRRWLRWVRRVA